MRTVVLGEHAEVDELIARRRDLGLDGYDEVWDGEYHVAPMASGPHAALQAELIGVMRTLARPRGLLTSGPINLGPSMHDFRVPDVVVHRTPPLATWFETAAMVVEVVSPDDESWLKFDHYAAHGVDEVLIADPTHRELWLFALVDGVYEPADASALLGVSVADLHAAVDWPANG